MHQNGRRWALRESTAEAHRQLDEAVGQFDSEESYRGYLVGMAAFRIGVEAWVSTTRLPLSEQVYQPSLITSYLTSDLDDLHLEIPAVAAFDPDPSPDAAWGVLYVLEGSAIGAQLLARRASALGFHAAYGARHLSQQSLSMDTWRSFLRLLEDAQPFNLAVATSAAVATFDAARLAFRDCAHA